MAGLKTTRTTLKIPTKGPGDLINITDMIGRALTETGLKKGTVCVFVVGSTAAITTLEYEPGLVKDMQELFEKIAPSNRHYHHDETWGDNNGSSHIRASLFGPSIVIPFEDSKTSLGTWQQVVLAEFDNRSRSREVILQFSGE